MPELPEVETIARGVRPHLVGCTIVSTRVRDRRLRWPVPAGMEAVIAGRRVRRVSRRAKYLLFRTDPAGGDGAGILDRVDRRTIVPVLLLLVEHLPVLVESREDLLVRHFGHFLGDRLTFDLQLDIAKALGYARRGGRQGVERFMTRYYKMTRDVGALSYFVLASVLDDVQAESSLSLPAFLIPRSEIEGFRVQNNRLQIGRAHV